MWLTGKLAPDFKTIADFRKDNGHAIQRACSEFIVLCRELGLFARTMVAIDGAKFKAVNARKVGRFGKHDFIYQPEDNSYQCPAGQKMRYRFTSVEQGKDMQVYWADGCGPCRIKSKCTTGKERRVKRWTNEDITDAMRKRLNALPEAMAIRRATVEHPFGTRKSWMGVTHFLTKRLKNVKQG